MEFHHTEHIRGVKNVVVGTRPCTKQIIGKLEYKYNEFSFKNSVRFNRQI